MDPFYLFPTVVYDTSTHFWNVVPDMSKKVAFELDIFHPLLIFWYGSISWSFSQKYLVEQCDEIWSKKEMPDSIPASNYISPATMLKSGEQYGTPLNATKTSIWIII